YLVATSPSAWGEVEGDVDAAGEGAVEGAVEGEDVVGYAAASLFADVAELQRIAVAPYARRTGVASLLLARVEREASVRYAEHLLLEVREDNTGACAFYAARGFTEIDRRPG